MQAISWAGTGRVWRGGGQASGHRCARDHRPTRHACPIRPVRLTASGGDPAACGPAPQKGGWRASFTLRPAPPSRSGAMSLSRRKDPGVGRERCDGAGGRVCGGCGYAVWGWGGRARMCSIGRAGAVLHIRPGPAGGGLAESCGNALALNAVEILPCAERAALHMGARPLKTDILEEPRNHAENSESTRGGDPLQCATPPHGPGRTPRGRPRSRQMKQYPRNRPGKNPTRPAATLRQNPAGSPSPAGDRPQPSTPGRPADLPHPA